MTTREKAESLIKEAEIVKCVDSPLYQRVEDVARAYLATLEWVKKVPDKPGIYLRKNPRTHKFSMTKAEIFYIDDVLWISGEAATPLNRWKGAEYMWWYGPIPEVQKEKDGSTN